MLRQQYLGDQELLRDAVTGREDPEIRLDISDRIQMVRQLAEIVGLPERELAHGHSDRNPTRYPSLSIWITLALVLSTVAVYTAMQLWAIPLPSLFIPVITFVTLRHGRRVGAMLTAGCCAAWLALVPFVPHGSHIVVRGLAFFACVAFSNWLIRRDLF
jgi:hypothetical protein